MDMKHKGGEQKLREEKMHALQVNAAKCQKLTFIYS